MFLIVISAAMTAQASNLGVANGYNLFSLSNLTATSDSEGSVASGGNVTFTSYSVGSKIGSDAKLVVNGNLTWSTGGTVGNPSSPDGSIYVGGTCSLPKWSVGYSHLYTGQDEVDFAAASAYLNQASTSWSQLKSNGTAVNDWGTLTLTGTDTNLNVFTLTSADLARSKMSSMNIIAPEGSTVLINVSGDSVEMKNFSTTLSGITQNKLLFNFYDATTFTLSGCTFEGSILAPEAAMNFVSGNMNGTLIDYTHKGGGEMHNYLFTGNLPSVSSVPEPVTLASLIGGVFGVAAIRRKI
jgi:choice-of-anchor A domain-containing protein